MSALPMLSVILPCRNQADHIGEILPRYLRPLEDLRMPFELVVVPNACSDDTEQVIETLARSDPRIRLVANSRGGWGLSVRTGLQAARGEVLVYTNTARTDPGSLPGFVARYRVQGGLVKASRQARHAPLREVGSLLYNLEGRLLFGLRCRDVNGTPKVFGRDLYQAISLTEPGDLLDLELMAWAARLGVKVGEMPVRGFRRHGGKSSTTLQSAGKMYLGALRLWLTADGPKPQRNGSARKAA